MVYKMNIAGVDHELPICKLNDNLSIGAFVIFGNVELTCACAKALLEKAPEFDYMIAPEAKAIPLIHEMARQSGRNDYLLVRKNKKAYMQSVFEVEVQSITTAGTQKLYMDGADAAKLNGKRVLILDDVISTGESIAAVEDLVKKAGLQAKFHIASAAVSREEIGNPVYPPARRELAKHGIACDGHAAHQITRREYEEFDYIYYMDRSNASYLRRLLPDTSKCFPLLDHDVADPWYTGDFTETWNDVLTGCTRILEELR